jgi:hypothetical protein
MVQGPDKSLKLWVVVVLVVGVFNARVYIFLVLLGPYFLLTVVTMATETVVSYVLLRELLPLGHSRLGVVFCFVCQEDIEVLFCHPRKVALDLFEWLTISTHPPHHGFNHSGV